MERALRMRPRVSASSFDVEASTSHDRVSQTSTSWGHASPTDPPTYEAHEAQQEESIVVDAPVHDSFSRGPYDTSLLLLYAEHAARHVWERNVYLFTFILHLFHTNWVVTDVDTFIFTGVWNNKICKPFQEGFESGMEWRAWFQDVVRYSRLACLCTSWYKTINHGMLTTFLKRWHKETSHFHVSHGDMSITFYSVSSLLHISIKGNITKSFSDQHILGTWVNGELLGSWPKWGSRGAWCHKRRSCPIFILDEIVQITPSCGSGGRRWRPQAIKSFQVFIDHIVADGICFCLYDGHHQTCYTLDD